MQSFCPLVERLGFDENFLDITTLVNERMHKSDAVSLDEVSGHIFADQAVVGWYLVIRRTLNFFSINEFLK